MKFKFIRVFLIVGCVICGSFRVSAQAYDYIPIFSGAYDARLSIEADPIAFFLEGYSVHLRYQPVFSEHFLIGVGTYAMDLPGALIDLDSKNRGHGWDAWIRSAYSLYGELYLSDANAGWFIGEQIGIQNYRVRNHLEGGGTASFSAFVAMTYGGYSWRPRNAAFYLKPWIGLGFIDKIDGVNTVGNRRYQVGPLFPMLTLHVGYTFGHNSGHWSVRN